MTASTRPDAATRLRVSRALSTASIEPAGLADPAILIVRSVRDPLPGRLRAPGGPMGVPEPWQRAMRAELADAWRAAARPALGRAPPGAPAVLFADPAEMLAAFALDASASRVSSRWWWAALSRGWAARGGIDLTDLWVREARHVPAALAWLDSRGDAAAVVATLTPAQADRVLGAMAEAFRLPLPLREARSAGSGAAPGAPARQPRGAGSVGPAYPAPPHAAPPGPPWRPYLPVSAVPAGLMPAQQALLGVGLLLHRAPLVPRREGFATALLRWRARAETRPGDSSVHPGKPPKMPTAADPVLARAQPAGTEGESRAPHRRPRPGAESPAALADSAGDGTADAPAGALPGRESLTPPTAPEPSARAATSPTPAPVGPLESDRDPDAAVPGAARSPLVEAHSTLCGVFFLINALQAVDWFGRADAELPTAPFASGWSWVELVARRLLGRRARPADPLWRVLAVLDGRDTQGASFVPIQAGPAVRAHLRNALPPLRSRLTAALAAAGGDQPLDDALFRRTGLIQAGLTHVDVRMDLDQVTLPVRITGLDVNPGWVPELARVVTFHFG